MTHDIFTRLSVQISSLVTRFTRVDLSVAAFRLVGTCAADDGGTVAVTGRFSGRAFADHGIARCIEDEIAITRFASVDLSIAAFDLWGAFGGIDSHAVRRTNKGSRRAVSDFCGTRLTAQIQPVAQLSLINLTIATGRRFGATGRIESIT